MTRKKAKYSLQERQQYYSDKLDKSFAGKPIGSPLTKKEEYALGYLQAVERGRPLDFDKCDPSYKKGVLSGERAKGKSQRIKF